jgi:hypothetical protein
MGDLYFRTQALDSIAIKTLKTLDCCYLNLPPQPVPIEKLIEEVYGLCIDYMRLTEKGDELGRMIYDDGYSTRFNTEKDGYELIEVKRGTMLIEALLAESKRFNGRYRFTLAHELSHWILHKKLYEGTHLAAATFKADAASDDSTEWQANYLAKAILMPNGQVKRAFCAARTEYNTNAGRVSRLAGIFQVSKQAMEIRLNEMGLVL